ncbi:hypothetical protein MASR2M17_19330 [Aminivibrio sp.]
MASSLSVAQTQAVRLLDPLMAEETLVGAVAAEDKGALQLSGDPLALLPVMVDQPDIEVLKRFSSFQAT